MQWLIDIVKEWLQLYLKGMIVIWSGEVVDIPEGWHLCDGTEDTPDLRDRFIVGAGTGYSPGAEDANPTHHHTVSRSKNAEGGTAKYSVMSSITGYVGALPPYYALCYIMKL